MAKAENPESRISATLRASRVVWPILIGLSIVGWLLFRSFRAGEFPKIEFGSFQGIVLSTCLLVLACRHFAYMLRLRLLTDGVFSWRKYFELVVLWEFTAAVTPTSVGGSFVAMYILSREKLKGGHVVSIITYSMVLDSLFFLISLPIWYRFLGVDMVLPGPEYGFLKGTFWLAYAMMTSYCLVFIAGLFVRPQLVRSGLIWLSKRLSLKRYSDRILKLSEDIYLSSMELKGRSWFFHIRLILVTLLIWFLRFLLVLLVLVAFVPAVRDLAFEQFMLLLGRLHAMYVVLVLSPTPGGSGIAEAAFGPFLFDFVVNEEGNYQNGLAVWVAFIWRLIEYYSYLIGGAILIPLWWKKVSALKETDLNTN